MLASRPAAAEAGLTFAALGDLLADVDPALYEQLPDPQRHALAAALLLEAPPRGRAVDQRAVGVALLGVLRALEPVVVAIDDAQWADPSSAAVVAFAWRRLRSEHVGFVLAVRAGVPSPFELADTQSHVPLRRVQVGPLSVGALHRVIRDRLGLSLRRPMLMRVHDTSRGNPFYALELARFLGAAGEAAPGTPLPVTDRLADVAELRLVALPPAGGDDVLLAIALLGDSPVEVIGAALGDRAATDARIADAVAAGILDHDGGDVRFVHPLLAEAVHARASGDARRRVHRLLAAAPLDPEQRARHLALAADRPDRDAAVALDDAAEDAAARGALASAAERDTTSPTQAEPVAARRATRRSGERQTATASRTSPRTLQSPARSAGRRAATSLCSCTATVSAGASSG